MSLYYPPLTWPQTRQIWTNHIKRAKSGNTTIKVDHDTLIAHAESLFNTQESQKESGPVWNGRQIRNAFQSAVALAGFRIQPGQPVILSKEHFEKVSEVSNHFNNYLWHVKRAHNDADMARIGMLRDDGYASFTLPQKSSQQIMIPETYSQQPLSTFGRNVVQGMTSAPIGGGYMPHMAAQQAHQQSYAMSGLNGMAPASYTQTFGTQPQFQQIRQEQQQPVFTTQTHFQQTRQEQQPVFTTQTQFQQTRQEQPQPQPPLGPSPGLFNQQPNQSLPLQAQ